MTTLGPLGLNQVEATFLSQQLTFPYFCSLSYRVESILWRKIDDRTAKYNRKNEV